MSIQKNDKLTYCTPKTRIKIKNHSVKLSIVHVKFITEFMIKDGARGTGKQE